MVEGRNVRLDYFVFPFCVPYIYSYPLPQSVFSWTNIFDVVHSQSPYERHVEYRNRNQHFKEREKSLKIPLSDRHFQETYRFIFKAVDRNRVWYILRSIETVKEKYVFFYLLSPDYWSFSKQLRIFSTGALPYTHTHIWARTQGLLNPLQDILWNTSRFFNIIGVNWRYKSDRDVRLRAILSARRYANIFSIYFLSPSFSLLLHKFTCLEIPCFTRHFSRCVKIPCSNLNL